jgi:hypothetical protein
MRNSEVEPCQGKPGFGGKGPSVKKQAVTRKKTIGLRLSWTVMILLIEKV